MRQCQCGGPSVTPQPSAGWYSDPVGPRDSLRYWDGQAWTEHISARSDRSRVGPPSSGTREYLIDIRVQEPESFQKWLEMAPGGHHSWNPQWAEGSRWPVVVAVDRLGQKRQLVECETKKKAAAEVERVRANLETLGLQDWCEKYGVPWSFVTAYVADWRTGMSPKYRGVSTLAAFSACESTNPFVELREWWSPSGTGTGAAGDG
jgi:Protein of unknown function (DUF2510)